MTKRTLPSVSFIVTCYNKGKYIEEVLDAVVAQKGNFIRREIIIVNDCSSDNSRQVIRDYRKNHPQREELWFKYIENKTNQGVTSSYMKGILSSNYEYIKFVDGDDILEPYTTERLIEACEKYDCVAACCQHAFQQVGGSIQVSGDFKPNEVNLVINNPLTAIPTQYIRDFISYLINGQDKFLIGGTRSVVRRRAIILRDNFDFIPEARDMQDFGLTLNLANNFPEKKIVLLKCVGEIEANPQIDTERLSYSKKAHSYWRAVTLEAFMRKTKNLKNSEIEQMKKQFLREVTPKHKAIFKLFCLSYWRKKYYYHNLDKLTLEKQMKLINNAKKDKK